MFTLFDTYSERLHKISKLLKHIKSNNKKLSTVNGIEKKDFTHVSFQ